MKLSESAETPLGMSLQLFASAGDTSAAPTGTATDATAPDGAASPDAPDGGASSNGDDSPVTNADELAMKLQEMQLKLQKEEQRRIKAEESCSQITRENSKLKRSQMTEAERLAEQQREADEKAKQYDRMMSSIEAEKIFVNGGLKEDDYKDFLELFVNEDKDRTVSIAQGFMDILSRYTQSAAKTEREKVLKETPLPPMGKGEEKDLFCEGFRAG